MTEALVTRIRHSLCARSLLTMFAMLFLVSCQKTTNNKVSVDYYQISGNSTEALDREIKAKGPKIGDDQHAIAVARIRMHPDVEYIRTKGRCLVKSANVAVDAQVTLPQWTGRANASAKLGKVWDNIDRYTRLHEAVHVSLAFRFAKAMKTDLEAIQAQKNCTLVDKMASAIVTELLRKHDKAQKAFDADEKKRFTENYRASKKSRLLN